MAASFTISEFSELVSAALDGHSDYGLEVPGGGDGDPTVRARRIHLRVSFRLFYIFVLAPHVALNANTVLFSFLSYRRPHSTLLGHFIVLSCPVLSSD